MLRHAKRPYRHMLLCLFGLLLAEAPAFAEGRTGASGLPLPRFVSLNAPEVNMRGGPGQDYRILWTYRRKGLPVEVIAEFEHWRKVRDSEGTEGWILKDLLSGRRSAIVTGGIIELRRAAAAEAPAIARLEPGVIVELTACKDAWCRIATGPYRGFLPRTALWGLYPDEVID